MYHSWFIHSPADEHLDCLQFGAIMNEASITIYVQFLYKHVFISLG